MLEHLHALEQQSIHVIREALCAPEAAGDALVAGQDSNTLLWLVRKAFLGRCRSR